MRIIGKNLEATRETSVVASGTIESGISVVVNSDGTVSAVSESSVSEVVGTPVLFEDASAQDIGATFDSTNNKVVLAYMDRGNSDYGTAVVGTVSGTSITFGTPVVFDNGGTATYIEAGFDENAGKVVIVYRDGGNSQYGTSIVGTVSGTSISFGTAVVFNSAESQGQGITYDSSAQKMVVTYRDEGNSNYGTARVGTVSGTSISYGSEVVFQSQAVQDTNPTYDANAGKIVVAYRNATQTNDGYAAVGTVSGTSISFGTPVVWSTGANATSNIGITYDSNAQKVVICYKDANESNYGRAIVGTVSGTSISFGSPVNFLAGRAEFQKIVYDTAAQKIVIVYEDTTNSQYGTVISGTVSGTSITFDTASVFESAEVEYTIATYDSNAEKVVIAYRDSANSNKGTSVVYQPAYTSRNLTAENFVGFSKSGAANGDGLLVGIKGSLTTQPETFYGISDLSYDNKSFSVSSEDGSANAIRFNLDGTKMFMIGHTNDSVFQYSLSTAYDISTASYDSVSFSVSSEASVPTDFAFNSDGTKMFVCDFSGGNVYQYSLSTGFDISTASYDSVSFNDSTRTDQPRSITWKPDGTKFYMSDNNNILYQYACTSAFDLSTASYDSKSFDSSGEVSDPKDFIFNDDGTKGYVLDDNPTESIHQYSLSTAYDISTMSYDNISASVETQESTPADMNFNNDGSKVYILGAGDTVYQYSSVSGLTAGSRYYVQNDGTLSTTAGDPSVSAGIAVSSTKLLVKG
jgi:hypothetical protein